MSDADRAQTLIDIRRYDEAVELLSRHLGAEPDDWSALCLLSQAHLATDRDRDALAAAKRAAALAPSEEWPFRLQALALLALGRPKKAVPLAERSAANAPGLWQPLHTLTGVYLAAGRKRRADEAAQRLLAAAPNEAEAVLRAAEVSRAMKRHKRAAALTDRALALDPTSAVVHNDWAVAMLEGRRHSEALRGFSTAAALDPRLSVAAQNFQLALRSTLSRATLVALLVGWLVGRGVADAADPTDEGGSLLARSVSLLVAVGLPAYLVHAYRRTVAPLPEHVRAQVAQAARQDRRIVFALVSYGIADLCYAAGVVLPNGPALDAVVAGVFALVASRLSLALSLPRPAPWVTLALAVLCALLGASVISEVFDPVASTSDVVGSVVLGATFLVAAGLLGRRWRVHRRT